MNPISPMSRRLRTLAFALVAATSGTALGAYMHPADLQPGDQYHVMFVSTPGEQVHNALSTDINVYNTFINGVGNDANSITKELNTTWKVAGSTPTVSARTNTGIDPSITGFPIYRPDGVRLANDYASLWGGLLAAPNITERGLVANDVPVSWAHTGSRSDGTPFPARELGGTIVAVRTGTFSFASAWMNATGRDRFTPASFYGVSELITVAVPEPTSLGLIVGGLFGFAGIKRRR